MIKEESKMTHYQFEIQNLLNENLGDFLDELHDEYLKNSNSNYSYLKKSLSDAMVRALHKKMVDRYFSLTLIEDIFLCIMESAGQIIKTEHSKAVVENDISTMDAHLYSVQYKITKDLQTK